MAEKKEKKERRKRGIALREKVIEALSSVAFSDGAGMKPSEKMKALELLGKEAGLFGGKAPDAGDSGSNIRIEVDYGAVHGTDE